MKRFNAFTAIALTLSATMGCSDKATQHEQLSAVEEAQLSAQVLGGDSEAAKKLKHLQRAQDAMLENETVFAPDIQDGWQWSTEEIAALTKRAKLGDMKAADRLYQFYAIHEDEANKAYWEDWLFKHGDRGAVEKRVFRIHKVASKRSNDDPRKLIELREAEKLLLSVYPEGKGSLVFDELRSEIALIERSR